MIGFDLGLLAQMNPALAEALRQTAGAEQQPQIGPTMPDIFGLSSLQAPPQEQMTMTMMPPPTPPQGMPAPVVSDVPRVIAGEPPIAIPQIAAPQLAIAEPPVQAAAPTVVPPRVPGGVLPVLAQGATAATQKTGTPATPPWQPGQPFDVTPQGFNQPIKVQKYDPQSGDLVYVNPLNQKPMRITPTETQPGLRQIYDDAVNEYNNLVAKLKSTVKLGPDEQNVYDYDYDPNYPSVVTLKTPTGNIPFPVRDVYQYRQGQIDPDIKLNYEQYLQRPFVPYRSMIGDASAMDYEISPGVRIPTMQAVSGGKTMQNIGYDDKLAYEGVTIFPSEYDAAGIPKFDAKFTPDVPVATQQRVMTNLKELNEVTIPQTLARINTMNNPELKQAKDEIIKQLEENVAMLEEKAKDPKSGITSKDIKAAKEKLEEELKMGAKTDIGTLGSVMAVGTPTTVVSNTLPDWSGVSQTLRGGAVRTPEQFAEDFKASLVENAPDAVRYLKTQQYDPTVSALGDFVQGLSGDLVTRMGEQAGDALDKGEATFVYTYNGQPKVEKMSMKRALDEINDGWTEFNTGNPDPKKLNRALQRFTGQVYFTYKGLDPDSGEEMPYEYSWESSAPFGGSELDGPAFRNTPISNMTVGPSMIIKPEREAYKPDNLGGAVKPPAGPKAPNKNYWRSATKGPGKSGSTLFQPGTSFYNAILAGNKGDKGATQFDVDKALRSDTFYKTRVIEAGNAYLDATKAPDAERAINSAVHTVNGMFYTPAAASMRKAYSDALHTQWSSGYGVLNGKYSAADFSQDAEKVYNGSMTVDDFVKKYVLPYNEWEKSDMARVWKAAAGEKDPLSGKAPTNAKTSNHTSKQAYEQLKNLVGLYATGLKNKSAPKDKGNNTYVPIAPYDRSGAVSFFIAPGAKLTAPQFADEAARQKWEAELKAQGLPSTVVGSPDTGAAFGVHGISAGPYMNFVDAVFAVKPDIGDPLGKVIGRAPDDIMTRALDPLDQNIQYRQREDGVEGLKPMFYYLIEAGVLGAGRDPLGRWIQAPQ